MRTRTGWLAALFAAGLALAPMTAQAQVSTGPSVPPADPVFPFPLYSSRPERGGLYTAAEFIFFRQTNPIKHQLIAIRGFNDFDGSVQAALNIVTGNPGAPIIPGAFFGSGSPALDANQVSGPNTYQPGFGITLGWRFGEGSPVEAVEFRWRHLAESRYSAVASIVPSTYLANFNLEDTFLFSPVFNFPNEFAGPVSKVGVSSPTTVSSSGSAAGAISISPTIIFTTVTLPNGATATVPAFNVTAAASAASAGAIVVPQAPFGIWNAATTMSIDFVQRYDDFDLIGRIPVYQGEACRVYGLVGPRLVGLWERFRWRTIDVETAAPSGQATATVTINGQVINTPGGTTFTITNPSGTVNTTAGAAAVTAAGGSTDPADTAEYTNIVSNRMYGPMIGCGSEWYLGGGFAVSLDLRAGLLLDVVKERAKYERGDGLIANKRSRNEFTLVPELDARVNMTWYPIEGVEMRLGYEVMTFFNTISSPRPVSFNYGALDPPWEKGTFRMLDGFSAGLALIF